MITKNQTAKFKEILKLKNLFDDGSPELRNDYWTKDLLQTYSETLGERIHWKWIAFLEDLKSKSLDIENLFGNSPLTFDVLDWGCGPGTASHAIAQSLADKNKLGFRFEDRSKIACLFAEARLKNFLARDPKQSQMGITAPSLKLMLISYVLSELDSKALTTLANSLRSHDLFLWVDSGSHKESRRLSETRNSLQDEFIFLAPCPHQKTCPLSQGSHPTDWCHRFAKTPQEAFHTAHWAEFSKIFGVDLRSLPYSSLFAVKKSVAEKYKIKTHNENQRLGRPFAGKFDVTLDFCNQEGEYAKTKITKRASPELFKKLKKEF